MYKRLLIIFILGFSSGLPLALLTSTLQAWFATTGVSIYATGFLSLLGLPYLYRVFWGPLLDRYSLLPIGKRRSWILIMQILLCLGFNVMAWCSPMSSPKLLAGIGFLLACFSATQDVAIDAHRTEFLPDKEHALGASIAVLGYRLALFTAGGVALILAQYLSWAIAYRVMGLLMIIGMLAIYYSPEPSMPNPPEQTSWLQGFIAPIRELSVRPGICALCCFILLYKLAEAFTTTHSGIVMPFLIQGLGFPLTTIAYINKILGISAIVLGGLVAGYLLLRWSLYRALVIFGLLQAMTNSLFVLLASMGKNTLLLALAVTSDNFVAGMGATALVAFFMRIVDKRYTATQFSLLVALSTLPRVFSGPMAATLQSWFGWVGLYQCSVVLAFLFLPFLLLFRQQSGALIIASLTQK